jgi:hypothetical protein
MGVYSQTPLQGHFFFTASCSDQFKYRIVGNFSSQTFVGVIEGGAVSVFVCKESVFSKYPVFRQEMSVFGNEITRSVSLFIHSSCGGDHLF